MTPEFITGQFFVCHQDSHHAGRPHAMHGTGGRRSCQRFPGGDANQ